MDFYKIACEIEEQGYEYYHNLATSVKQEKIAGIFLALAHEEKKHHVVFETLKNSQPMHKPGILKAKNFVTDSEKIFRSLVESATIINKNDLNYSEVLDIALALEHKSIATYENAFTIIKAHADKEALSQIIAEEKKHVWLLTSLSDFNEDPQKWFNNPEWYSA